ncbi:PTS sugar transporter subunit IIA [Anoxybacteroides rupiense]|uniref:PTS sugar transporter subunit IIA n=1 Tax=Anoxybacteroides rupiense TaxID=311460 RepID=UPI00183757AD|nr:PTS sugar transporter subunit IIA [Anoxybacillus rupiensis]MBB3908781.1 mannitol/fructose-specific phosphotransferase system IIA component (Ntr-type) [Anoxybacillus rupiensis]
MELQPYLKHQLDGLFSTVDFIDIISAREYENRSYSNVDFIVSTVPIKEAKHPTFIVNPILNDKDKERLIKKVHALTGTEQSVFRISVDSVMDIIKQYSSIQDEKSLKLALKEYLHQPIMTKEKGEGPNLLDILKGQYVTFLNEVNDWEDAIRKAAHPLLQDKVIQPSYVHAMIQYVKKLGPYNVVVPNVALPHGKPEDGALKLGMSLLILQKPVSFSSKENHQVRLLFVLSSIDNQLHLRALSQLSELLSSRKTVVELMECKTKESVLQILSTS